MKFKHDYRETRVWNSDLGYYWIEVFFMKTVAYSSCKIYLSPSMELGSMDFRSACPSFCLWHFCGFRAFLDKPHKDWSQTWWIHSLWSLGLWSCSVEFHSFTGLWSSSFPAFLAKPLRGLIPNLVDRVHSLHKDSPTVWCPCVLFPTLPQFYMPFY